MPVYCYKCPNGHISNIFRHKPKPRHIETCQKCRLPAIRCISAEHVHTDLVSRERFSDSMGVNPDQIQEAKKLFPGSEYLPDGRLKVKNRADKKKKLKERGYIEYD